MSCINKAGCKVGAGGKTDGNGVKVNRDAVKGGNNVGGHRSAEPHGLLAVLVRVAEHIPHGFDLPVG